MVEGFKVLPVEKREMEIEAKWHSFFSVSHRISLMPFQNTLSMPRFCKTSANH